MPNFYGGGGGIFKTSTEYYSADFGLNKSISIERSFVFSNFISVEIFIILYLTGNGGVIN
jgi:hypothetical protein